MKTASDSSREIVDLVDAQVPLEAPKAARKTETVGYGSMAPARPQVLSPFAAPTPRPKPAPVASPAKPAAAAPVVAPAAPSAPSVGLQATIGYAEAPATSEPSAIAATLVQDVAPTLNDAKASRPVRATSNAIRTTVLPRVEWNGTQPALDMAPRTRFETIRSLGEGGVGEVSLAHDHDIDRPVAVKRLHPHFNDAASLVRFAEEVRVVGKLEHPNIAPVHDVGIDEDGQHFFLMKYVEGETVEQIIEKLRAHDPVYELRFSIETRVDIFRGILRALQYAHARGVIHRDIKPSNVMVGPFGEVVLMDWGIAKQLRASHEVPPPAETSDAPAQTERARIFRTQHGTLLGTPAYMSPEQARGKTDQIDERSDIYSACVLFLELLTLEHHLADKQTVPAVLAAVAELEVTPADTIRQSRTSGAPIEYLHLIRHGMQNDRAKRFQSVNEVLERLQASADGHIPIECPVTFVKRINGESMHFVDRHPVVTLAALSTGVLSTLGGIALAVAHFVF